MAPAVSGKATRSAALLHGACDQPRLHPGIAFTCTMPSLGVDSCADMPAGLACFMGVLVAHRKTQSDRYIVCLLDTGRKPVCALTPWKSFAAAANGYSFPHTVDYAKQSESLFASQLLKSKSAEALSNAMLNTVKRGKDGAGAAALGGARGATDGGEAGRLADLERHYKTKEWPKVFGDHIIKNEGDKVDGSLRLKAMIAVARETCTVTKTQENLLGVAEKTDGNAGKKLIITALQGIARAAKRRAPANNNKQVGMPFRDGTSVVGESGDEEERELGGEDLSLGGGDEDEYTDNESPSPSPPSRTTGGGGGGRGSRSRSARHLGPRGGGSSGRTKNNNKQEDTTDKLAAADRRAAEIETRRRLEGLQAVEDAAAEA